ncbi:MAG: FAD binding domain-containing protein [Elusimicrobiota bacterium]
MNNLNVVYYPGSIKEFSKVYNKKSHIIAGSTYFFKAMGKNTDIKEIISIKKLGLRYIKTDSKNLKIGALSTFDDVEHNTLCKNLYFGFLSKAASQCSSQLIRNMATIGGNIAHPNAFNIMPLVIETLNGKVKVYDGKKYETISLSDYYKTAKKGLIVEILLPLSYNKNIFYFEKVSKTNSSWESYITFSFRCDLGLKDIRLVFGAINSLPVFNKSFEDEIIKKKILDEREIENISNKYAEYIYSLHPTHKYANYRKQVVYATVKEFIKKVLGR